MPAAPYFSLPDPLPVWLIKISTSTIIHTILNSYLMRCGHEMNQMLIVMNILDEIKYETCLRSNYDEWISSSEKSCNLDILHI